MLLGLKAGPLCPMFCTKLKEPCPFSKVPHDPYTQFSYIVRVQKKRTLICISEWRQGPTLTQNVDWGFVLSTTFPKILTSSGSKIETQICNPFPSKGPGTWIPSRFFNGAPVERNTRLQDIFTSHITYIFLSLWGCEDPWILFEAEMDPRAKSFVKLCCTVVCMFSQPTTFLAWTALTLRWLMSYIYGAPILDVSRSHTTTQHSR